MPSHRFEILSSWNGETLLPGEWATVDLLLGDPVEVRVEAAYYGDPAPIDRPGRQYGLWEFEVVELFLLGDDDRYLEIELGPHGHWLALSLAGPRVVVDDWVPIEFEATQKGDRWTGRAQFDPSWLPTGLARANAYAIHGVADTRRHLATTPLPGDHPDFHRLDGFSRFLE